ncbi:MAG: hypothetical protein KF749_03615 [Bacteroidetes bacterium]|nr:hypothetical protein [Bacteroidota bacterium]MCW5897546.1 hypothetical protein [Bacteroidota bacterium]
MSKYTEEQCRKEEISETQVKFCSVGQERRKIRFLEQKEPNALNWCDSAHLCQISPHVTFPCVHSQAGISLCERFRLFHLEHLEGWFMRLVTIVSIVLVLAVATARAQEFPIANGNDNTFGFVEIFVLSWIVVRCSREPPLLVVQWAEEVFVFEENHTPIIC